MVNFFATRKIPCPKTLAKQRRRRPWETDGVTFAAMQVRGEGPLAAAGEVNNMMPGCVESRGGTYNQIAFGVEGVALGASCAVDRISSPRVTFVLNLSGHIMHTFR